MADENNDKVKEVQYSEKDIENFKIMQTDMLKYKAEKNDLKEQLQKLNDANEANRKENLEKNEEWKVLYENERDSKQKLSSEIGDMKTKFVNSSKINTVLQEIGGFKKSEYARFIQPDLIELDDSGVIKQESLKKEVDRINQNYAELLNTNSAEKKKTNEEASTLTGKKLQDLNGDELLAAYTASKQKG